MKESTAESHKPITDEYSAWVLAAIERASKPYEELARQAGHVLRSLVVAGVREPDDWSINHCGMAVQMDWYECVAVRVTISKCYVIIRNSKLGHGTLYLQPADAVRVVAILIGAAGDMAGREGGEA